jgi:hypothetical protein
MCSTIYYSDPSTWIGTENALCDRRKERQPSLQKPCNNYAAIRADINFLTSVWIGNCTYQATAAFEQAKTLTQTSSFWNLGQSRDERGGYQLRRDHWPCSCCEVFYSLSLSLSLIQSHAWSRILVLCSVFFLNFVNWVKLGFLISSVRCDCGIVEFLR